jgi:DNA-binding transcriptional regulator YiaG
MPSTTSTTKSKARFITIPGLQGVRIITIAGDSKLELRNTLGMAREVFGRLVNVSVRTIAEVESKQKKVDKLQRNYVEVKRLCDALSEVVDPACLGEWLKAPNGAFDDFKPLEVIERGEIDRLWEMVYRLRSGMPG